MNKLEIAKDSLFHRLAVIGGLSRYATESDSCEYVRSIIIGAVLSLVAAVALTIFADAFINMLLGIVFSLVYGEIMFTAAGWTGVVVTASIAGVIGCWYIAKVIIAFFDRPKKETSLAKIFRAWKDRYCIPISFKEQDVDINQTTEG